MAPNVTLHFFRNRDINGPVLLEVTDEDEYFKSLTLRPDLTAVGGAEVVFARRVGMHLLSTDAVAPEAFCRVLVHAYSDTEYFTGFFLDKRHQVVVDPDEDGGEEFRFGGPGPKYYLDRAVLGIVDHLGAGWHLDLENGVWQWMETATAGRILNRCLLEDAAKDAPALPDLSWTFDANDDTNGDTWTTDIAQSGEYEIPIGRTYLQILFDLEDASGLQSRVYLGTVSAPAFELQAYNDGSAQMGTDVTATSFTAGKVILREGVNIGDTSLELEGRSLKKVTHVIVEGKNHTYEFVEKPGYSAGDYTKYALISYPSSANATVLHRVGVRYLLRQERADKALTVPIVPGASESTGYYFPKLSGPLWLGNTITLDTAADGTNPTPVDFDNEPALVTGFDISLGPAGDTATADRKAKSWDVKVKLNQERGGNPGAPSQTTVEAHSNGCTCPAHPDTGTPGTPPTAPTEDYRWSFDDLGGGSAANLYDDNTSTIYWFSPNWEDGIGTSAWHADYDAHMSWGASGAVTQHVTPTTPGIPVTAGELYTFDTDMSQRQADSNAWLRVEWYSAGGTQLQIDYIAGPGVSVAAKAHYNKVITAPATATFIRLRVDAATGEFGAADNIVISHGGSAGTAGTPGTAPVTTVGGTGSGTYSGSTDYVPVGSVIEHSYITDDGLYHRALGISIDDDAGYYVGTTVEAALAEIGAGLNLTLEVIDPAGAAQVLDISAHSVFELHLSADCDISVSGLVNGRANRWWVHVIGDGSSVPSFPDVLWPEGTAPTFDPTAGSHWLEFISTDGSTVYGDYGGLPPVSSALDDLTDVTFTSPADGDVLTYDSGSGDWINQAPSTTSSSIWRPVMASDGTNWYVVVDGDGTAVMAEG